MTWVIVPFSRPEMLGNVRSNFSRQLCEEKHLCIVENGRGVGACADVGFEPDLLLTSDNHPSLARNVALARLREMDAHFCCMDDDDYYSAAYVQEHVDHAKRRRITGKVTHWVHFEGVDALWLFNRRRAGGSVHWVHAATLGGFSRDIPDFPVIPLGEENALCKRHLKAGGEIFNTSVGNFLYRQGGCGHTYDIPARMFAYAQGPIFEEHPCDSRLVELENPPLGRRKAWNQV